MVSLFFHPLLYYSFPPFASLYLQNRRSASQGRMSAPSPERARSRISPTNTSSSPPSPPGRAGSTPPNKSQDGFSAGLGGGGTRRRGRGRRRWRGRHFRKRHGDGRAVLTPLSERTAAVMLGKTVGVSGIHQGPSFPVLQPTQDVAERGKSEHRVNGVAAVLGQERFERQKQGGAVVRRLLLRGDR